MFALFCSFIYYFIVLRGLKLKIEINFQKVIENYHIYSFKLLIIANYLVIKNKLPSVFKIDPVTYTVFFFCLNFEISDGSRLEKSPLLANGYNHPPTHLNHMQQFMQFNHHPAAAAHAAAALLSHQGLPPPPHPGLGRPQHDPASLLKGQPLPPATMDALTR